MNLPNQVFTCTLCAIFATIPVGIWIKKSGLNKRKKEYRKFLLKYKLVLAFIVGIPFWITSSMTISDKLQMFIILEGLAFIMWKFNLFQRGV